jgi:hypothetical protein
MFMNTGCDIATAVDRASCSSLYILSTAAIVCRLSAIVAIAGTASTITIDRRTTASSNSISVNPRDEVRLEDANPDSSLIIILFKMLESIRADDSAVFPTNHTVIASQNRQMPG